MMLLVIQSNVFCRAIFTGCADFRNSFMQCNIVPIFTDQIHHSMYQALSQ